MPTVIKFPVQRIISDRRCIGCFSSVAAEEGVEIKLPSMQLQGEHVSVLCQECYEITPEWVWVSNR